MQFQRTTVFLARISAFLCFGLLSAPLLRAQMTVNTGIPPQQVIQNYFIDPTTGIQVSNVVYNGVPDALGVFDIANNTPNIGMDQGIILTSGSALDAPGPNNLGSTTTNNNQPGDPDLDNILTGFFTSEDATTISFDFTPTSDTVYFRYIFASEEYPEFAPPNSSTFNDVFGFFIQGAGYPTPTNIATLPGTNTTVSINNVNAVTNSSFYVDNDFGTFDIEYDGFTVVIEAKTAVTPCTPYNLKLAIADVGDGSYDSAVLLEANSFSAGFSPSANAVFQDLSGNPLTYEGCPSSQSEFVIQRSGGGIGTTADTAFVSYYGTATYGVDYDPLPDTIIFPPGVDSVVIPINPLPDGLIEGPETIIMGLIYPNGCTGVDTVESTIIIEDNIPPQIILPADTGLCSGNSITLTAFVNGGTPPVQVNWAGAPSNGPTATFTVTSDTTFYVTALGGCNSPPVTDSINVNLLQPNGNVSLALLNNDTTLCAGNPIDLVGIAQNGTGQYSFDWFVDGAAAGVTDSVYTLTPTDTATYVLTVNDGCTSDSDTVDVGVLPPLELLTSPDTVICAGGTATVGAQYQGGLQANWQLEWFLNGNPIAGGDTLTLSTLAPNSSNTLVAVLSDNCSAASDTDTTIVEVGGPITLNPTPDFAICLGDTATVAVAPTGGNGAYAYSWTYDGQASTDSFVVDTPTATTVYNIEVTDACNTTPASAQITVTVIPPPDGSFTISQDTVCIGEPLEVSFTGGGTGGSPVYDWDFGNGTILSGGAPSAPGPFELTFAATGNVLLSLEFGITDGNNTCFAPLQDTTVFVRPALAVNAFADTTICAGGTPTLTATASGGLPPQHTVNWLVNGNNAGTGFSISPTGLSAGQQYTYQAILTDNCTTTPDTAEVTVEVLPEISITMPQPVTICQGDDVTLDATATGGDGNLTYTWDFNGQQQTGASLTTTLQQTTTFQLTVSDGCETPDAQATVTVTVLPAPVVSYSFGPDPACQGAPVTLEFDGSITAGEPTFSWEFGPDASVQANPDLSGPGPFQVVYTSSGEKPLELELTLEDGGASCTSPVLRDTLTILPQPEAAFAVPDPQCLAGNSFTFGISNSSVESFTYRWSFSNANPNTALGDTVSGIQFQRAGTQVVGLEIQGAGGLCTDVLTREVTIWENPDVPTVIPDTICTGFRAEPAIQRPGSQYAIDWYESPNGGEAFYTGRQYTTPRLSSSVTYFVESRNPETGCVSTAREPLPVTVNGIPNLKLSASHSRVELPNALVTFNTNAAGRVQHFLWSFGDGATSELPNPTHQYSEPGTYSVDVVVTDAAGCTNSAVERLLIEVEEPIALQVPSAFSPNGDNLNDFWYLNTQLITEIEVQVYNRYGRMIYSSDNLDFRWDGTDDTSGEAVPEGVYPYKITATLYDGRTIEDLGTITVVR